MRGTGNRVKKTRKPPDDKTQSQRFVETARALEADESGKAFERALKVVVPTKPKAGRPRPSGRPISSRNS